MFEYGEMHTARIADLALSAGYGSAGYGSADDSGDGYGTVGYPDGTERYADFDDSDGETGGYDEDGQYILAPAVVPPTPDIDARPGRQRQLAAVPDLTTLSLSTGRMLATGGIPERARVRAQEPAAGLATEQVGPEPECAPELAPATIGELQARIRQMQGTRLDTHTLPTHPAIAALLPGGGLKQGAAYSVDRSATLLMALLAGPSAAGSWCGVVGVPEFGVEAAARYGIDLERLVLVPHPGDQWLGVTAAIADVLTVVVTRPPKQASDASVARLAARLRQRGATLIVLGPWPQTDAMLSISHSRWTGIGEGHGHLAAREATITVSTRAGGVPRSTTLWLPDRSERFTSSDPVVAQEHQSRRLAG